MREHEPITLKRDVVSVQIPYGDKVLLTAGTIVMVQQVLGGNYTVMTDRGWLVRVEGKDADALGFEPKKEAAPTEAEPLADAPGDLNTTVKRVWEQLKTCYDPEIPVNIVDLGLVYECKVEPHTEGGFKAEVKMTVTAPGCGMGGILSTDAREKILSIPGVKECSCELVWDPPWNQTMMSEAAKLQLGMF